MTKNLVVFPKNRTFASEQFRNRENDGVYFYILVLVQLKIQKVVSRAWLVWRYFDEITLQRVCRSYDRLFFIQQDNFKTIII